MLQFVREWQATRRFAALPAEQRNIVFYSEGPEYWIHLQPLVDHLVRDHGRTLCYLSSSADDPGLALDRPEVIPFQIGTGAARTTLFYFLRARVVVMTMPDLNTLHIKRSVHPVHYVHVFHSLVSTHMVYRHAAFDHFDTLFCVGPHHVEEVRRTEEVYGLPKKALVEHGYGRLDSVLRNATAGPRMHNDGNPRRILLAPSWGGFGRQGLLETVGKELVATLLGAGMHVTVRPHPMSLKQPQGQSADLRKVFAGHHLFEYDDNVASEASLHASHLMISDWSGAALDYAFGRERPVLFVDVPRKVNNPNYERLGIEPIEAFIREEVGAILSPVNISAAPALAAQLIDRSEAYVARIQAARSRWVYNVGSSGARGAQHIVALAGGTSA